MKVHYSSDTNEWATPQDLYDKLDEEFNFTLDPCATDKNAKCDKYYTIKENGLIQDWSKDVVFMNPPYGREIKHWVLKAYLESKRGAIVVCLIPSRTDTRYWHDYIFPYAEIRFLKNRMYFKNQDNEGDRAPFPSAVVVFDKNKENKKIYGWDVYFTEQCSAQLDLGV